MNQCLNSGESNFKSFLGLFFEMCTVLFYHFKYADSKHILKPYVTMHQVA